MFACAFDLAGAGSRPRICLVATAGGDQTATINAFHQAFAGSGIRASHLALFDKPNVPDVREHLLAQDVIWVDRGSLSTCSPSGEHTDSTRSCPSATAGRPASSWPENPPGHC